MADMHKDVTQRRRLQGALRRWRREAGLSHQEAAKLAGFSLSKLIRLENGEQKPRPADVTALLVLYKAPVEEATRYGDLARSLPARSFREEAHLRGFDKAYVRYLEYEQSCIFLRQWNPLLIPGLLQTELYAQEILTEGFGKEASTVRRMIEVRLERQRLLEDPDGPSFHFILDESVMRRVVGSPDLMRAQVEHILSLRSKYGDRVQIDLLPFKAGATPGLRGPFILLEFEDDDDDNVLYIENPTGDFFSRDDQETTGLYQENFALLEDKVIPAHEFESAVAAITASWS